MRRWLWSFLESCDSMAVSPVFYQVAPENLPLYIDLGSPSASSGEEARVPLEGFSLEGATRADLRHSHRRAVRDGAGFEMIAPRKVDAGILPQLRARLRCVARGQEHRREALLAGLLR